MAAWPAVALFGSYELLMTVIRNSQASSEGASRTPGIPNTLQEQVVEIFAEQWRRIAFPPSARSALNSMSASPGHSDQWPCVK